MIMGDLGKAHRIHVAVNNHQAEQVLETSCMIVDHQFSILIDPRDTESFISSVALKIINVKVVEQDDFIYV
jgi:hypothetical protein